LCGLLNAVGSIRISGIRFNKLRPLVFIYRNYDLADLETQYDIDATVPDLPEVLGGLQAWSEKVKPGMPNARYDQAYGADPLQTLDIFPAAQPNAPVMFYVHGGYWIGGDKAGRMFPAELFNERGITWISINYRLAPAVTLDEIVDDVRTAFAWVYENAASFGGDKERLYVAGTSAGGHLTGMLLARGWHGRYKVPEDVIKGACAMSGLYDLQPFLYTSQKEYLRLDPAAVARNSPIEHLPDAGCPLVVSWGGRETDEFIRQSVAYAEAWGQTGAPLVTVPMPEQNHFSLMGEMGRVDSPLAQAMLGLVDG